MKNKLPLPLVKFNYLRHWQRAFARLKIQSSQILITAEDLNERRKYLNIRNTIYSLMDLNVIPIINENDTTSTEEIRFGDNDKLSAMIANALSAELVNIYYLMSMVSIQVTQKNLLMRNY